jgi:SAM-dependent methyltransferase
VERLADGARAGGVGAQGEHGREGADGARRVVDVGCGTGIVLREYPWQARVLCGCDASNTALAFTRRRGIGDLVRGDVTALPFLTDSVDVLLALDVIEHLDDDAAALRDLARVLRPGGHLLLHVPAFNVLWSDKDDINQHRRRYRRSLLLRRVREAGLEPVSSGYLNAVLFPVGLARGMWQRVRRPDPQATTMFLDRLYYPSGIVNRVMTSLLTAETHLVRWLPFGMSLLCVARKPALRPTT